MKTPLFVLLFLFPCVLTLPQLQRSKDTPKPDKSLKSEVTHGSKISSEVPNLESAVKFNTVKDFSDKSVLSSQKDDTFDTTTDTNAEGTAEGATATTSETASPSLANLSPKKLLANSKIQEAIVDKGIEVAGKLVDKQLKIIDEAQEKAANFLKKEIKLDIIPDKGWENEDMFTPPGYHIGASVSGLKTSPKDKASPSFVFPSGIGGALMNGCYGRGYQERDPCFRFKKPSGICWNMIDGAAFMGVGFDGQGKYSPESRKVSIVQRKCGNKQKYGTLDVPDTMNVHGIYETSASMKTYESREEYRRHLQQEAGVSGSYFGFSAGVKEAWGEASASAAQKYMAVMDVDVDRYEIFMDEVKPHDLSLSFLREFLNLPTSYFSAGGPLKYQNFIQRWGTHFIKSAKFGGQLEIRKTMSASDFRGKSEFEVEMEMEYKTLFASVGAKAAAETGSSRRKQSKTTSTSLVVQGGSQDIASILSDVYSPTFKTQFKEWLKSIPQYPKAFRFQMGSITDLLNFKANDLFSEETVNWGCEGNAANLETEERNGKTLKYYETTDVNGTVTRNYCEFDSRQALEDAIHRRRTSLKRAIEIYMEEGTISISDIKLDECNYTTQDQTFHSEAQNPFRNSMATPSWEKIVNHNKLFKVSFDMVSDLPNAYRKAFNIDHNMSRLVQFHKNKWYTSNRDGSFHLYNAFNNGKSSDTTKRKISILGLVLTFDEAGGNLILSASDFKASKRLFPTLSEEMKGAELARVEMPNVKSEKRSRAKRSPTVSAEPCQVKWSNALRFDPTDTEGKCLHFTASSAGTIFVMLAALPKDLNSRYYVEISPLQVAIYKNTTRLKLSTDINARALGDASLYQSYFVCITESENSSLIEYGKSLGTSDSGDIYLTVNDNDKHLHVRFYAFGNDENPAKVMDAHIVPRQLTRADCKGDTVRDVETNLCHQLCHEDCDPLAGCKSSTSPRLDDGCNACRVALDVLTNTCIPECPQRKILTAEKECRPSFDLETRITFNESTPTFQELTLCAWIKVDRTYETLANKHDLLLFNIYDSHTSTFSIMMKEEAEHMKFVTLIRPETPNVDLGDSQKFTLDQLKDYEWHHISVTWSGFVGVVRVFLDGTSVYYGANRQQRGTVGGSPLTKIGDLQLSLTELNVWDHILSDQKLASNALQCFSGKGNVFHWHQFYEATMRNTTLYRKPSLCDDSRNAGES